MTSEHLVASQVEHARLQALRTEETDSHASSRDALSQFGWTTAVSQRTGETYYLNEATGESTMTSLWRLLDKLFLRGGLQRYRAPQVRLTTPMKLHSVQAKEMEAMVFLLLEEKDEQLAQKDGELEQLRAQLERLEGVPPQ